MSKPRIALGGLVHETHAFAEPHTTYADFEAQSLYQGQAIIDNMGGSRSGIGGMIEGSSKQDWEVIPTFYTSALPSGMVEQKSYERLVTNLVESIKAAMPLDGVILALHGAMVTEDLLDAETDILERIRAAIGSEIPIVVELDMHGNISERMLQFATTLVAFDTNPHIDSHERGLETTKIMQRILTGEIKPTAAYAQPAIIMAAQSTGTADLPLSAVHARAAEMEAEDDVIAICVMGGFGYADAPFVGPSIIVTTNNKPELAQQYANELSDLLWQERHNGLPEFYTADVAVARALEMEGGPIILVDSADNIGGGTPGDGTDALKAMLDANVQEGCVVIADIEAVAICFEAGIGTEVSLSLGAKTDEWHGQPVQVTGIVKNLSDGVYPCELPDNHFAAFYGDTIHMGRTVWLRAGGVNIIITERKTPPFDLAQLRGIGVIPEDQKMIAVKSAVAYRAAYLPIAKGVIEMDTAGLCSANLKRFPFKRLRRPIFPLDEI